LKADTARPSPDDMVEAGTEQSLDGAQHYRVEAHSSVILIGR
jgi:hypothetical protein